MIGTLLRRAALVVFGLILGFAALEGLLQLGALAVRARGGSAPSWSVGGAVRLVALGDSNTYGLYVGKVNAYPRLLETGWNGQEGVRRLEVLNLGYPGNNSSVLRNRFRAVLGDYRPDAVLIQIGVNDFWSMPEPIVADDESESVWVSLARRSRTGRLLVILERSLASRPVERLPGVEGDERWAPTREGNADWRRDLQENVAVMVEAARGAGAVPVLLTYGAARGAYGVVNEEIRQAAAASGAPLIDVASAFDRRCRQGACDLLFWDEHPTDAGHQRVADTVLRELRTRNLIAGSAD
jgi:lysophospholipase L1-like esterase